MQLTSLRLAISAGLLLFLISCNKISTVFTPESPRAGYVKTINESPFGQNELVKKWLSSGDSVLSEPVPVNLPFQTKVVYFSDEANAWAWQFSLQEGRTFRAHLARTDTSHQVFMDLFIVENGGTTLEQSAEDSMITHTLDEDQTLILRLQPELLINGSATLTISDNPSMEFPVSGAIRADIGSFWGDPRDGGRRQHKGVDIFANRGTPVVAAAEGRVTRTGNGGLGGKTVWLRAGGKSLYFAHLDSITTRMGQSVQVGDTVGFVGNTGNARTTPPHLHFGIYDRGAVNPLPFIDFANERVEPITANPSNFPKWGRITAPKANVRPLPSTSEEPFGSLTRHNPVQILSGTGEWYQVRLPTGQTGFIFHTLLEPPDSKLESLTLDKENVFYSSFSDNQPTFQTNASETIDLFGSFQDRQLGKFMGHWVWIK